MYSIFRKIVRRRHSPLQPDGLHLHMLVHRSFANSIGQASRRPQLINPPTSALLWCLCLPGLLIAIAAPRQQLWLIAGIALQIALYAAVYRAALASAWCSPPPTGNIPCYQARHPRRHSKLIECVVPPAVPFETLI